MILNERKVSDRQFDAANERYVGAYRHPSRHPRGGGDQDTSSFLMETRGRPAWIAAFAGMTRLEFFRRPLWRTFRL